MRYVNIPNMISLGRLFLAPIFVWLIATEQYKETFYLCLIAGVSDILDGMLARILGDQTKLGKYLDPIADKVLLVTLYITMGVYHLVPLWLVILVVFRDFLIIGGALMVLIFDVKFNIRPIMISKFNTLLQLVLVLAVFSHAMGYDIDIYLNYLYLLTALTTFISGAAYVWIWNKEIATEEVSHGKAG